MHPVGQRLLLRVDLEDEAVELEVAAFDRLPGVGAGEGEQVGDEPPHPLRFTGDGPQRLIALDRVGVHASQQRFDAGPDAVSGVRSSCDASARKRFWVL